MAQPSADAMVGYESGAGMGNVSRAMVAGGATGGSPCVVRRCAGSQQLECRRGAAVRRASGSGKGVVSSMYYMLSTRRVVDSKGVPAVMRLHKTDMACATSASRPIQLLAKISHVSRLSSDQV